MLVGFEVNGRPWEGEVRGRTTLADLLRDGLGLTGTHLGCEQGVCGACTVLLDGRAVRSCLLLAVQAAGARSSLSKAWVAMASRPCRISSSSGALSSAGAARRV